MADFNLAGNMAQEVQAGAEISKIWESTAQAKEQAPFKLAAAAAEAESANMDLEERKQLKDYYAKKVSTPLVKTEEPKSLEELVKDPVTQLSAKQLELHDAAVELEQRQKELQDDEAAIRGIVSNPEKLKGALSGLEQTANKVMAARQKLALKEDKVMAGKAATWMAISTAGAGVNGQDQAKALWEQAWDVERQATEQALKTKYPYNPEKHGDEANYNEVMYKASEQSTNNSLGSEYSPALVAKKLGETMTTKEIQDRNRQRENQTYHQGLLKLKADQIKVQSDDSNRKFTAAMRSADTHEIADAVKSTNLLIQAHDSTIKESQSALTKLEQNKPTETQVFSWSSMSYVSKNADTVAQYEEDIKYLRSRVSKSREAKTQASQQAAALAAKAAQLAKVPKATESKQDPADNPTNDFTAEAKKLWPKDDPSKYHYRKDPKTGQLQRKAK